MKTFIILVTLAVGYVAVGAGIGACNALHQRHATIDNAIENAVNGAE